MGRTPLTTANSRHPWPRPPPPGPRAPHSTGPDLSPEIGPFFTPARSDLPGGPTPPPPEPCSQHWLACRPPALAMLLYCLAWAGHYQAIDHDQRPWYI